MSKVIGYVKRNNGIRGPGFAEWDEPIYGEKSVEELERSDSEILDWIASHWDSQATGTQRLFWREMENPTGSFRDACRAAMGSILPNQKIS